MTLTTTIGYRNKYIKGDRIRIGMGVIGYWNVKGIVVEVQGELLLIEPHDRFKRSIWVHYEKCKLVK